MSKNPPSLKKTFCLLTSHQSCKTKKENGFLSGLLKGQKRWFSRPALPFVHFQTICSNNIFDALNRETIMLEIELDENQSSMESLKTKTNQLPTNLPGSKPLIIQNGEQIQHKLLPVSVDKITDHTSSFLTHLVSHTNSLKQGSIATFENPNPFTHSIFSNKHKGRPNIVSVKKSARVKSAPNSQCTML